MQYANEIERASKRQKWSCLRGTVRDLSAALESLAILLLRYVDAPVLPP